MSLVGWRRVFYLAQAEVLHVVRDRATLAQVLVMPVLQLLVLANAATFAIHDTPAAVVDLDHTASSRGIAGHLAGSGHFRLVGAPRSIADADEALLDGTVTMAIVIPRDFERDLVRTGQASVELSVDAVKGAAAGIVQAYAAAVLADYAVELGPRLRPSRAVVPGATAVSAPVPGATRIDVRMRSRYNPTLDYQHYMVPGILVALVTMIGTLLTAQNIAREKELGTIEQLNVTPITRAQFILGKLLPFWGLAMLDLAVGLLVGRLVFDIPMQGSLPLLFGVATVYLAVALGIGLWVSALVETQQQAMFVTFFVINIYLLLSGLFTPIDSMAPWVRTASQVNPVRHFVTIARAILVKGAGPAEIARPLSLLVLLAVVVLTCATRQYRKRVS